MQRELHVPYCIFFIFSLFFFIMVSVSQVIKPRLGVIVISSVTDRVQVRYVCISADAYHIAPCIVSISCSRRAAGGQDFDYVALRIVYIVIQKRTSGKTVPHAVLIIKVIEILAVGLFLSQNRGTIQNVFRGLPVHRLGRADAVRVVGIAYAAAVLRESGKLSSVLPCHRHTVSVGKGIADFVIGDRLPVVRGKQILPQRALIAPCVGNAASGTAQDVSAVVVSIGFSNAVPCLRC